MEAKAVGLNRKGVKVAAKNKVRWRCGGCPMFQTGVTGNTDWLTNIVMQTLRTLTTQRVLFIHYAPPTPLHFLRSKYFPAFSSHVSSFNHKHKNTKSTAINTYCVKRELRRWFSCATSTRTQDQMTHKHLTHCNTRRSALYWRRSSVLELCWRPWQRGCPFRQTLYLPPSRGPSL
jgi:hypothetical protein